MAILAVLNDIVSVELGTSVDIYASDTVISPPPSIIARLGIYAQLKKMTTSFSVYRDLWNPAYPASVMAGIGLSWEIK